MIEREWKVSELRPGMVVRVWKFGRPAAQMEVCEVHKTAVIFHPQGNVFLKFLAFRTGPDLEQITDDDGVRMRIFA